MVVPQDDTQLDSGDKVVVLAPVPFQGRDDAGSERRE